MAPTIDLRSDTVTLPTPAMRAAMAQAPVGDDVFEEDPTINALEARGAAMLGKEAGLFVPSGTMGNLIATTTHCRPGETVILGELSHIFTNEAGGMAALGGLVVHVLPDFTGKLDPERVETAIRPGTIHTPGTRLICVENSHNFAGGVVSTAEELQQIKAVATRHDISLHLDGARIFNAAVALGVEPTRLAAADTITLCFSKGLAAPVGSLLVGSRAFITRARYKRKQLGGGMRQAGILAAAAMVALDTMIERLTEDHANARRLAEGLCRFPEFAVALDTVQTNIVIADLAPPVLAADLLPILREGGVLALPIGGPRRLRFVTHYGVTAGDIDRALAIIGSCLRRLAPTSAPPVAAH